eukprot:6188106-Pleurochrysis_carterae.AAC.7
MKVGLDRLASLNLGCTNDVVCVHVDCVARRRGRQHARELSRERRISLLLLTKFGRREVNHRAEVAHPRLAVERLVVRGGVRCEREETAVVAALEPRERLIDVGSAKFDSAALSSVSNAVANIGAMPGEARRCVSGHVAAGYVARVPWRARAVEAEQRRARALAAGDAVDQCEHRRGREYPRRIEVATDRVGRRALALLLARAEASRFDPQPHRRLEARNGVQQRRREHRARARLVEQAQWETVARCAPGQQMIGGTCINRRG